MRRVADGSTFAMAVDERVLLADGSVLRYAGVLADSRCPPDVQCVWAGNAEVSLQWTAPRDAAVGVVLHSGRGHHAMLGERRLELVELARAPRPRVRLRVDVASGDP